jgi:hypothetical protein
MIGARLKALPKPGLDRLVVVPDALHVGFCLNAVNLSWKSFSVGLFATDEVGK